MIVTFHVLVGSGSLKLNDRVVQSSKLASDASMYTENMTIFFKINLSENLYFVSKISLTHLEKKMLENNSFQQQKVRTIFETECFLNFFLEVFSDWNNYNSN